MKVKGLTARAVETAKPGKYCDGRGLWLVVSETRARKWVYRFSLAGKPHEMGLGAYPDTSLADAREKATDARRAVKDGRNPIEARQAEKVVSAARKTFGEVALAYVAAHESSWRNEKHRWQWRHSLETYCKAIWGLPIDEVTTEHVLAVLQPIWLTVPETASRLRGRLESILDAGKAQELRSGENPARWRAHLDHLLARRQKLTRGHQKALPYSEAPSFVAELRKRQGMAARALEFVILTAARSGEARLATWAEIDLGAAVWTVPAARMKASREHRVPLVDRAIEILREVEPLASGPDSLVFPGTRGKALSDMTLAAVLRRMKVEAVPHGFRSSFRDWAGDETSFPREVAEAALAHIAGDETERAYRRSDALEKRRELMAAWTDFLDRREAKVVKLRR